jgi:hypothetical protein
MHNIQVWVILQSKPDVYEIISQNPMSTRLAGRPKIRWENDTKEGLRIMKINRQCIQDWVKWKAVVEKAKTFSVVVAPDEEEAEDIKVMILLFESFFPPLSGEYIMN